MARGQATIEDPLSILPPLVLEWFDDGGSAPLQRGKVYKRSPDSFNLLGSAVIKGSAYGSRYVWSCNLMMPEGAFLLLDRYAEIQAERGYILFSDEVELTPLEQITGDRILIPGSVETLRHEFDDAVFTTTQNAFAKFRALLRMPREGPADFRYSAKHGQRWKSFVLGVEESPSVVL